MPVGKWARLAKSCLALIPSSLETHPWALAFFFFSFNDNSQGNWVLRGRSSSNRHILEGRGRKKGPAPRLR